jgi:hypothetical protein
MKSSMVSLCRAGLPNNSDTYYFATFLSCAFISFKTHHASPQILPHYCHANFNLCNWQTLSFTNISNCFSFWLIPKQSALDKAPSFQQNFAYDNFNKDLTQLTQLSGESAFIVRTFFFLIFGFTLNVQSLIPFRCTPSKWISNYWHYLFSSNRISKNIC